MKKLFILIQIYLLTINVAFGEEKKFHQSQIGGLFYSINKQNLIILSKELSNFQKNPLLILSRFKDRNIKDYQGIYNQVKLFEKELKKIKITISTNGHLVIDSQNNKLDISEVWFDGAMIVNNQKILWNPESDTLSDLQKQLAHFVTIKKISGFSGMFFLKAYAADPITFMLAGMAITLSLLSMLNVYLNQSDLLETESKIDQMIKSLVKSGNQCENDLNDTNFLLSKDLLTDSYNSETLKFIHFIKDFESRELIKRSEKLQLYGCENLKNEHKLWVKKEKIMAKLNEACGLSMKLDACMEKHRELELDGKNIVNTKKYESTKIWNDSSYHELYKAINPDTVREK